MSRTRKRSRMVELRDFGTPEIKQHHLVVIEGTKEAHARVADQRPMDRYWLRGELCHFNRDLNRVMYEAGCRLRSDWSMAGLEPRVTANLFGVGGGSDDRSDRQIAAKVRCQRALIEVGPVVSDILVHVACLDGEAAQWALAKGWRRAADGMPPLRLALEHLARHYRMWP